MFDIIVPDAFQVIDVKADWTEVRVRPECAIRPNVDFVRIVRDDETLYVHHMNHHGVSRGTVSLSGSMAGLLSAVVTEIVEGF